ncbi:unnamed protein product [Orchesella dallaii]|uniref:Peptidase S9A N-terminal domain-containing protein n=1 Tax=Orchesella dallaii TaxID=48710 RepID=A0ABP1PNL0_9HEXA
MNILYMLTSLDEDGDGQIVFDPSWEIFDINVSFSTSIFDKSGESFGDRLYSISPNGEVFAYGLSKSGSDWCTIHFKNVIKADFYPDKLKKVKDSCLSWTHDSQGLIYERYPDIQTYHDIKVYYHLLGTMQSEDQIIVEFEDNPTWELKAKVSECGHYLIVFTAQDCGGKSRVFYTKLLDSYESKPVLLPIVKDFEADYNYITNTGSLFYFLTNEGAPNSRILSVITFPDEDRDPQWNCIVEEHPKNVLDWASCVNQ